MHCVVQADTQAMADAEAMGYGATDDKATQTLASSRGLIATLGINTYH